MPQNLTKGQNISLDPLISSLRMSVQWVSPGHHGTVDLIGLIVGADGRVRSDGVDQALARVPVAYVPQDDIIHLQLPLIRTMRYAARQRTLRRSWP